MIDRDDNFSFKELENDNKSPIFITYTISKILYIIMKKLIQIIVFYLIYVFPLNLFINLKKIVKKIIIYLPSVKK